MATDGLTPEISSPGTDSARPSARKWQWPALVRRFPSFPGHSRPAYPIIATLERAAYPNLAQDFADLDEHLWPRFREMDAAATGAQNRYRAQQVGIILLGVVVTSLGAAQAAWQNEWLGGFQVLAAGLAAAVADKARSPKDRADFFTARLKAERLRGEYFIFLARVGRYQGDDRVSQLIDRVEDIVEGKDEP